MNEHVKLEVIDRGGWQKELSLERTIVHIGSDPRSDIVLEPARGGGVAPLHAQLIAANSGLGYQLVNLGDTDILLGSSGDQVLPPRSVTRLADGMVFKLGEFTLIFHCGDEGPSQGFAGAAGDSRYIGLKMSLPQTRLGPKRSLEGQVTVSNIGDRSGAQFNLELEGMEPDCFDIEPGPILAAGAMKEVTFRLYHRGNKPMAGDRRIVIRAAAPHAYPGEEMTVSQTIEILPLYRHSLRLLSPDRVEPAPPVEAQPAAVGVAPLPAVATEPSPQTEDWWTASPAVAKEPKPRVPAAGGLEATRGAQASAPPPSRATSPVAEAKPPLAESAAPASTAAPAAEPVPAVEAAPPVTEAAPLPAAEVTPAAESAPVVEVAPSAVEAVPPRAEAAPLPAVEAATPPAEVVLLAPAPAVKQAAVQAPQAEPAPAPPTKGWARLAQAIPFFRSKQTAPLPNMAEASVQPPAATPAMAEANPLPVMEGAPVGEEVTAAADIVQEVQEQETPETSLPPETQEWSVETETSLPAPDEGETTPAAEPIAPAPMQEQAVAGAGPQPQPVPGEQPAGQLLHLEDESVEQPEGAPRAEEEEPPPAEVAPEEAPRKRRALKLKASPPPETKEVWAPPVEAGPTPTEDWWTPQYGPEETAAEERVLKLKAGAPPAEKAEQVPPPAEDWSTAEAGSKETSATRPVLKLKASPPAEKEPSQAPVEAGSPPPAEDWWAAEAGEDAEVPAEKRQVLKLKASPPPEGDAEQTPVEGEPPPAEDWWTP
jgi:hypothetical protein